MWELGEVSTVVNAQVTVIQAKAFPKVVVGVWVLVVVSFWAAMACPQPGTVDIVPANRKDRSKCAD